MKYKVGDKVRIKSIDWYNENKDRFGDIHFDHIISFIPNMSKYCGKIATIKEVDRVFKFYSLDIDDEEGGWADDMFDDISRTTKITELKYGELYKDENGDIFVAAYSPDSYVSDPRVIKITRFIQEHKNVFQEYIGSYINKNEKINIMWRDKSGLRRRTIYSLITLI